MLGGSGGTGAAAEAGTVGSGSSHGMHGSHHGVYRGGGGTGGRRGVLDANFGDYAGRVAITAMASFGGSAVVTGGINGSVFLAHTINFGPDPSVGGVQLQWGGKGDAHDREAASGSVTCIAASKGSGYRFGADKAASKPSADTCIDEEEIVSSMDGCQVVAGTTGGSLRVWSLKDVYRASCMMNRDIPSIGGASSPVRSHHASGAASSRAGASDDQVMQDAIAGAPVGGHRGGVSCVDLPPRMYRPDSLVSGGEDGLIKLWSLKSPSSDQEGAGGSSGTGQKQNSIQSRFFNSRQMTATTDFDASDAQGVLTGHEGKIICIRTAWHGDRLLSGGADRTVRLWDLSGGGGGRPLSTLRGHQGWVTRTHFWGPNTIVSASTDRSIHLWDTRLGSSPLFALRYHLSPVSDLLLGNRSEPLMVSAGADGSLATWDFRMLSGAAAEAPSSPDENANVEGGGGGNDRAQSSSIRTVRSPMATMNHHDYLRSSRSSSSPSSASCGPVKLARAVARDDFSFFSAGDDGVVNEWEAAGGTRTGMPRLSGHADAISGFRSFSAADGLRRVEGGSGRGAVSVVGGTITCSWDGTVRLRRLSRKSAH